MDNTDFRPQTGKAGQVVSTKLSTFATTKSCRNHITGIILEERRRNVITKQIAWPRGLGPSRMGIVHLVAVEPRFLPPAGSLSISDWRNLFPLQRGAVVIPQRYKKSGMDFFYKIWTKIRKIWTFSTPFKIILYQFRAFLRNLWQNAYFLPYVYAKNVQMW